MKTYQLIKRGPFQCECGSYNTGQSTNSDWCNDCGYHFYYP